MKGLFGGVSLIVVLVVVGVLASRQMKTAAVVPSVKVGESGTLQQGPRLTAEQAQQQARDEVNRMMEQRSRDIDEATK